MNRFLRILFLALLLAPSVGHFAQSVQEVCADEQAGCCGPHGLCDSNCLQCTCCAARVTMTITAGFEELICPPAPSCAVVFAQDPPAAPPSDILHVPKSA